MTSRSAVIDGDYGAGGGQFSTSGLDLAAVVERVRRNRLPAPERRRGIRLKAGVTVREMACLVGVSPMAISRWERGATPARNNAVKYRQVLDALREAAA